MLLNEQEVWHIYLRFNYGYSGILWNIGLYKWLVHQLVRLMLIIVLFHISFILYFLEAIIMN